MTWYYASGGQQLGPVDEAALDDLVRQGVVRDDTLVWKSGMSGWQPHGTVRPRPEALVAAPAMSPSSAQASGPGLGGGPAPAAGSAAAPQPSQAEMRYCSECGRPHPASLLY